jgi:hypothetical protein
MAAPLVVAECLLSPLGISHARGLRPLSPPDWAPRPRHGADRPGLRPELCPVIHWLACFRLPLMHHLVQQCLKDFVPPVPAEMTPADHDHRGQRFGRQTIIAQTTLHAPRDGDRHGPQLAAETPHVVLGVLRHQLRHDGRILLLGTPPAPPARGRAARARGRRSLHRRTGWRLRGTTRPGTAPADWLAHRLVHTSATPGSVSCEGSNIPRWSSRFSARNIGLAAVRIARSRPTRAASPHRSQTHPG